MLFILFSGAMLRVFPLLFASMRRLLSIACSRLPYGNLLPSGLELLDAPSRKEADGDKWLDSSYAESGDRASSPRLDKRTQVLVCRALLWACHSWVWQLHQRNRGNVRSAKLLHDIELVFGMPHSAELRLR